MFRTRGDVSAPDATPLGARQGLYYERCVVAAMRRQGELLVGGRVRIPVLGRRLEEAAPVELAFVRNLYSPGVQCRSWHCTAGLPGPSPGPSSRRTTPAPSPPIPPSHPSKHSRLHDEISTHPCTALLLASYTPMSEGDMTISAAHQGGTAEPVGRACVRTPRTSFPPAAWHLCGDWMITIGGARPDQHTKYLDGLPRGVLAVSAWAPLGERRTARSRQS